VWVVFRVFSFSLCVCFVLFFGGVFFVGCLLFNEGVLLV